MTTLGFPQFLILKSFLFFHAYEIFDEGSSVY